MSFVLGFVIAVFWIAAATGTFGLGLLLSTVSWLPWWIAWPVAVLAGVLFGFAMSSVATSLRGIWARYAVEPPNNPYGSPLSCADLAMPFLIVAVLALILSPVFQQAGERARRRRARLALREHTTLRPQPPLLEIAWIPVGLTALMATARVWTRATRSLQHAAFEGDAAAVRRLLDKGVAIDALDPVAGRTALYWAILQQHAGTALSLLGRGADPDLKTRDGSTCLVQAARSGQEPVVAALLEGGADPNAQDRKGQTPLNVALSRRDEALADLLRQAGAQE